MCAAAAGPARHARFAAFWLVAAGVPLVGAFAGCSWSKPVSTPSGNRFEVIRVDRCGDEAATSWDRCAAPCILEHGPELWETLWGTVGLHPELRVRLIHGADDDVVPPEVSTAFEAVRAEAGYDVELLELAGGHYAATDDLVVETVMELLQ